jgi:hypothetical protein
VKKEEAVVGALVDVERDGEHEGGVIVEGPSSTGLVKVLLLDGKVIVRHFDQISPRSVGPHDRTL